MRICASGEILRTRNPEQIVTVELVLEVTRDDHNRLHGVVRVSTESGAREFYGTLELMRVFEELVPASGVGAAAGSGQPPGAP